MISGNKVYLTSIEAGDLEQLRYWRNLPEFRKHFREYREISSSMQHRWFEGVVNGDPSTIMRYAWWIRMNWWDAAACVISTGFIGIRIYPFISEKIKLTLTMKGLQKKAADYFLIMAFMNWA